jgi:probable HAF family extracellular repeat protein
MTNRMASAVVGLGVTILAACDDPTRPAEPADTSSPAPEVAALHRQYTIRDLGTFGGGEAGALGINELGEVVGFAQLRSGGLRAFLWRGGQAKRNLGTLGGVESRARAINDRSEVTGESLSPSDVPRAFLWTEAGGMRDLGTLGGETSHGWGHQQPGRGGRQQRESQWP